MGKTNIGWTDVSWNPVTGCSHVSEGCRNCYAETLSLRRGWSKKPWTHQNAAENVVLHPERLTAPLSWRKPRMVFVNSMSDLFHKQVPFNFVAQVFDVMADARASDHIFQVLTKRPARMRKFFVWLAEHWDGNSPANVTIEVCGHLPNVWLGVSAESQDRFDKRAEVLGSIPAAVRFVSLEPLLGPIDCGNAFDAPPPKSPYGPVGWVIVGGETGPGHRPMDIDWLHSIVLQCVNAHVPVFVKQASAPRPGQQGGIPDDLWAMKQFPERVEVS